MGPTDTAAIPYNTTSKTKTNQPTDRIFIKINNIKNQFEFNDNALLRRIDINVSTESFVEVHRRGKSLSCRNEPNHLFSMGRQRIRVT